MHSHHSSNLYPFNGNLQDQDNMQDIMAAIQHMDARDAAAVAAVVGIDMNCPQGHQPRANSNRHQAR